MSGHNRWSKIKHKKEASDSKKSKVWTKVIKELTDLGPARRRRHQRQPAAARGGRQGPQREHAERHHRPGHQEGHRRSRGRRLRGVQLRGLRPGGTAVLVEIMTDNRNRTAGEIRSLITRHGGNLGRLRLGRLDVQEAGAGRLRQDRRRRGQADRCRRSSSARRTSATEGDSLVVVTEPKEFERDPRRARSRRGCPTPVNAEVTMVAAEHRAPDRQGGRGGASSS